jgi:tRNA-dihydrouridine synthase 2
VAADVDGIDLNMGCPKKFSTQGGMGAALLKDQETAVAIVRALRAELPARIAVSCKVRLLEDTASTVALVRKLVDAGAQSIAIHLRQADWANSRPADWTQLRAIMDAVSVPVVANGSVFEHADIAKVRAAAGDAFGAPRLGVMIARGALVNPSMFRADVEPLDVVIRRYLLLCAESANAYQNTKYTVQRMLQECNPKVAAALGAYRSVSELCRCKSSEQIIMMWCQGDADGLGPCGDALGRDALLAALRAASVVPTAEDDGRVYTDEYILDARNEMGHGVGSAVVRAAAEPVDEPDGDERASKRPRVEACCLA